MERPLSGLARALSALGKGSAMRAELCRALAPVRAYDRRTGSDLARTLRVYVECGSLAETAERTAAVACPDGGGCCDERRTAWAHRHAFPQRLDHDAPGR